MLISVIALLIAVQQPAAPPGRDTVPPAKQDTTKKGRGISITLGVGDDSTITAGDSAGRAAKRIPVTPAHIATAYANEATRQLVLRARGARLAVDSTLRSYEGLTYQRMSAGIALRALARTRLAARGEQAARVSWDRDRGALIRITGARAVAPIDDDDEIDNDPTSPETLELPYVPGEDRLWPISRFKFDVNREEIIHPLGAGAEAYYRYAIGDSVVIRIPHGGEYHLIELRVSPRAQRWNAVIGSLWLDRESAQLVRAAYRLSAPLDVWLAVQEEAAADTNRRGKGKKDDDDIPGWIKPALQPMRLSLTAVTQEFVLQGGRWWLPSSRTAEGLFEMGPIRSPISWEERFTYDAVRGEPLPASRFDSLDARYGERLAIRDSAEKVRAAHGDSSARVVRTALDSLENEEGNQCRKTHRGSRVETVRRDGVRTFIVIPCDTTVLVHSADLPPSIYASADELFGETDRKELRDWAMSVQAMADREGGGGTNPRPTILYGIGGGLLRYNRVEGLSLGVRAEQRLQRGYSAHALARLGVADLNPGLELGVARSDPRRTIDLTAYHRLAAAGDYGDPFTLGASLGALLWGRDDGFYYRATGLELTRMPADGEGIHWRLFGEHEGAAAMKTNVSLAHLGNGRFAPNIDAERGDIGGIGASMIRSAGEDPKGWRLISSTSLEAAGGRFDYARGIFDLTLSHPLALGTAGSLTGVAGAAAGRPPIQKLFFVGGPQTVRGIDAGSAIGDAFWVGRGELGR
ncbi:MAG TPA: hypothetical protein VFN39_05165, partial [Gemmatimonadaceae bacterium]|nr:hypothetical protein [Gemmatimonadaceae bacterium]